MCVMCVMKVNAETTREVDSFIPSIYRAKVNNMQPTTRAMMLLSWEGGCKPAKVIARGWSNNIFTFLSEAAAVESCCREGHDLIFVDLV